MKDFSLFKKAKELNWIKQSCGVELGHSVEIQSKIASSQCLRHGRFNATMMLMSRNINNFLAFFQGNVCQEVRFAWGTFLCKIWQVRSKMVFDFATDSTEISDI